MLRSGSVDEAAFLEALRVGTIAGVARDSFETELSAADHPPFALTNVIATPQVGGMKRSTLRNWRCRAPAHHRRAFWQAVRP